MLVALRTAPPRTAAEQHDRVMRHQGRLLVAILVVVGVGDQVSKAWAWRHSGNALIDSGGGFVVASGMGTWFQGRLSGAVLDLAATIVVTALAVLLARRRRSTTTLVSAGTALAGWATNLADRLGLHSLTAPNSMRGVVDFLPFAGYTWNAADLAIIAGTAGLVVSLVARCCAPACSRAVASHPVPRRRPGTALVIGVVSTVVALTAVGACSYGQLVTPTMSVASAR